MICLGIESTAHTFGIGVTTDEGEILANAKAVYKPPLGKGIIPVEAAEHHKKNKEEVLKQVLKDANIAIEDVDVIAYSAGPGLPPALNVGATFAQKLAESSKKPLKPVNHALAHLEIGKLLTNAKDPIFVYLSGGNTQIIALSENRYRIFGETQDIPIGNCLDVVAREMNLPMPGGPEIEKLAKTGKYVELPYVVKGMDLSFTGIQTAAIKLLKQGAEKCDIAYSLQETCFAMLTEVTERAIAYAEKNEVLLVGGVAANKRLQEMLRIMCSERGAMLRVVPEEYSGDQGVMIAWVGILAHKSGWEPDFKDKIKPNWRIDEIEIKWS